MKCVAKIAKKLVFMYKNTKKRGADKNIFHHIAQYSIYIISISYYFCSRIKSNNQNKFYKL